MGIEFEKPIKVQPVIQDNGTVEIDVTESPEYANISLELLMHVLQQKYGFLAGQFVTIGTTTPVHYRISGFDAENTNLLLEKVGNVPE